MRRSVFKSVLTKRVIVHLTTDQSLVGSLMKSLPDGIVLSAAEYLNKGAGPTPMQGDVFIPREKVVFAQSHE